jgi:hypothetical protein
MKLKSLLGMLAGLGVAVGGATALPTEALAESYNNNTYYCAQLNGSWNTFVNTPRGRVTLINWVNQFSEQWTAQKRCSAVSQRFQKFLDTGNLKYIRTGQVNNYPVICVADARGGSCMDTNVLITLEKGTDAEKVLVSLVDFRRSVSGNTITLSENDAGFYSDGEFYVDMTKFLDLVPVDK